MPVDSNIPLLAGRPAGPFGPDLQQVFTLQNLAQQMQARKMVMDQEQQGQNALRQVFSDPNNVSPQGIPTANALAQIGRESPQTYLQILPKVAQFQQTQALTEARQGKLFQQFDATGKDLARGIVGIWDPIAKEQGPEAANRAAQDMWTKRIEEEKASGVFPTDWTSKLPAQMPPIEDLRRAVIADDAAKTKPETLAQQQHNEIELARLDLERQKFKQSQYRGSLEKPEDVEVTQPDGTKKIISAAWDKDNRTWVTADGTSTPIHGEVRIVGNRGAASSPEAIESTAEQIAQYRIAPPGSYAMSRGNGPEIMKAVKEINPDYNAQKYQVAQRIRNDFAAGARSATAMDATNTVVHHFGVLEDVEKALKNRDINLINRVVNYARTELGHPEATDFDVARAIISDEVIRAVVGSGAVFDRASMQDKLSASRSPEQVAGQIERLRQLMGGRLGALYQRWSSGNLPADEFVAKLEPETIEGVRRYVPSNLRKALGEGEATGAGGPSPSGAAVSSKKWEDASSGDRVPTPKDPEESRRAWAGAKSGVVFVDPDGATHVVP